MVTHKLKSISMWGVSLVVSAFLALFLAVAPTNAATEHTQANTQMDLETLILLDVFQENDDSHLKDWVVINNLFNSNTQTSSNVESGNLTSWILFEEVFNDEDSDSSLGDLVVFNSLFNTNMQNESQIDVGTWVLIEKLFGEDDNGTGILDDNTSSTDLEDLVVLNALFENEGNLFGTRTVTVQSGDTLRSIAQTYLGDAERYDEIAARNNISDPSLIFPGQVLQLPSSQFTSVGTNVESLILLDSVFGEDSDIFSGDSDFKDLIVLDALFGNGTMMSR